MEEGEGIQVELHRHLEGSIRFQTLVEQYKKQNKDYASMNTIGNYENIKLENNEREDGGSCVTAEDLEGRLVQYWKTLFLAETQVTDLTAFLAKFGHTQKLISDEQMIERITYETCEDSFKEGTKVLELRYSPQYILNGHSNLNYENVHQSVLRGIQKAQKEFDINVGVIGILDRSLSVQSASETLDFILQNKSSFVALDLANDELLFDSKPFTSIFQQAKKAGLNITVHAGESLQHRFADNVRHAIDDLGAQRIGHGVGIIMNDSVLDYVKKNDVLLEVCPSSNYLINVVPHISKHPIKQLIDRGVNVSISSDDPGLFGISLSHEYNVLQKELGFTAQDLAKCNLMGFKHSFISSSDKSHLMKQQKQKQFSSIY